MDFLNPLGQNPDPVTRSESEIGSVPSEPDSATTNARLGLESMPNDTETGSGVYDPQEMARLVDEALKAAEEEHVREQQAREAAEIQAILAEKSRVPDPVLGDDQEEVNTEPGAVEDLRGGDGSRPVPDGDGKRTGDTEPETPPDLRAGGRVGELLPEYSDVQTGLSRIDPPIRDVPVTERQAAWIAERLRVEDDLVACANTGTSAEDVLEWRRDPAFDESIADYLTDKRGAFRPLSAHLLPLAWQVIHRMLNSNEARVQKEGLKYLLQSQGLLINVQETTSSEALRRLVEDINRPVPVEIIDVKPR